MLTCQSPLCKMRACLYSHMRRLKKKKSHKKQHLCYRDVFNKYTERAPATKKSCQGQKEPSIGTVYISKFFQEEWKRLPSLMENGGATVRNLLAASSLRLLLQSSPLTRARSREERGGGTYLPLLGSTPWAARKAEALQLRSSYSWNSLFREEALHSEDSVRTSGHFISPPCFSSLLRSCCPYQP